VSQPIRKTRKTILAALMALAALVGVPSAAVAGPQPVISSTPCADKPAYQPYTQFGDNADYIVAPGGHFEGANGWARNKTASFIAANDPFYLNSSLDQTALRLTSGASAVSPADCAASWYPTLRFVARNLGAAGAGLKVEVLVLMTDGSWKAVTLGSVSAGSQWAPSPIINTQSSRLTATQFLTVKLRLTATGSGGDWHVDDVFVDPARRM